jgi:glycosyltransferase involved in cell wall biosynthesis
VTRGRTVMVCSFPPPIGGAALVNSMVRDALVEQGTSVVSINVAGPALAHTRGLGYHARRIARNLTGMKRAISTARSGDTLYVVPDAGAGVWYTAGHLYAAGRRYNHVVIHHHSCRYIEEHSPAIAVGTRHVGDRATHVFLTEGMAVRFQQRYGTVRFRVATNARLVAEEALVDPSASLSCGRGLRLGHLSNLCADKGFFAVADAFDSIRAAGIEATLALAGPILESKVGLRLNDLRQRHGDRVHHAGPLAGDAKRLFYRDLDLFLFPTHWKQEAAPLVIYESFAAGVPVLSRDMGMIAEIIPSDFGAVIARDESFSDKALAYIREHGWGQEAGLSRAAALKAYIRDQCALSQAQYAGLLAMLGNGANSAAAL